MNLIAARVWRYGALVFAVLVIVSLALWTARPSTAYELGDDSQNQEIIAAVQRYYDVLDEAYATSDVNVLAKAIADDPLYEQEIGRERTEQIREYITRVSGAERAKSIGYLTGMQNNLSHRFHGEQLLADEMAKAEAEGRIWTSADTEALADRNFGTPPTAREIAGDRFVVTADWFQSIHIDGDYARARFERVVMWNAIFKRIDGQWVVIGIYR